MKDYEQLVQDLRKENFDLKLRVHLLEERFKLGGGGPAGAEDAQKRLIDLRVEAETLRRELADKKELLHDAKVAIETIEKEHADNLTKIESEREAERVEWTRRIELIQKEAAAAAASAPQPEKIVYQPSSDDSALRAKIAELERLLNDTRARVVTAEDEARLCREELAARIQEVDALKSEVVAKDDRIFSLNQAVEVKEKEVAEKEKKVQTVQEELKTVKPEIVTKTREIEDKDKIIEEKNSQLEQQQKILVEIQITLDEKQKELEEYERKLRESRDRIKELEDLLNSQMKGLNQELEKKIIEIKRKDRRLRDMEAQMKELQDSLNKAKWEAEQGVAEGGVKEMAEEEMETLWTRLEEMKRAMAELTRAKQESDLEIQSLKEKLARAEADRRDRSSSSRDSNAHPFAVPGMAAQMPQQSIHIQPQFVAETADVAALTNAVSQLSGRLDSRLNVPASSTVSGGLDGTAVKSLVEMEVWGKNQEIERLQKQIERMAKDHGREVENLREDVEDRERELNRLRDKARKLRSALEDARGGKENSGSSSNDQRIMPIGPKPLQETNANVFHVYAASPAPAPPPSGDTIPASLLPLLAACHEETVDALKTRVAGLQAALSARLEGAEAMAGLRNKLKVLEDRAMDLEKEKRDLVDQCQREIEEHRNQVVLLTDEIRQLRRRRDEELSLGGPGPGPMSVDWRQKYQNAMKKYKKELALVKKRLAESHNACAMLRTRLEEMADFLDQIFAMEEQGLLDLSVVTTENLSAMRRSLDATRELSRSLSQSLVVAVIDEEPAGCCGDDDDLGSFSSHASSSFGLRTDGSPATPEGDGDRERDRDRDRGDGIKGMGREEVARMKRDLEEKTRQLIAAGELIDKLRAEANKLAEGVKVRDIEIGKLTMGAGREAQKSQVTQELIKRSPKSRNQQQQLDAAEWAGPNAGAAPAATSPSSRRKQETSPAASKAHHHHHGGHHHHHHSRSSRSRGGDATVVSIPSQQQIVVGAGVGKGLSPSESEAWSEPDRNVSMARIGLDQTEKDAAAEQVAGSQTTSSSSDDDSQKMAAGSGGAAAALTRTLQQNRKLQHKIKALEVVNDSLKAELVACHAALGRGEGDQALFAELKSLRDNLLHTHEQHEQIKLHLKQQQQEAAQGGDALREEREKVRAAQAQADRYRKLCDHSETQIRTLSQRNEELEKDLARLKRERASLGMSMSGKSERDQRRDLEDWYKVKAVEMQNRDQKKVTELQDALGTSEAEKKELKVQLNEARARAERQAEAIKDLEIRCSRLDEELHNALDELTKTRVSNVEKERELREMLAGSDAEIAKMKGEEVMKIREKETAWEAERLRAEALEAELASLEEVSEAALRREKADHLALVLELKQEIQSHKEKANALESQYVDLLVAHQRLVEAKNYSDELEARQRECLDKCLQVDDYDGPLPSVSNGVFNGIDTPESVRSFDCMPPAVVNGSAQTSSVAIRSASDDRSGFNATNFHPLPNSPAAYSSPDQGIESDARFLPLLSNSGTVICPDCRGPLPDQSARDSDDCSASMGILQLELKLVREENSRLLAELTESRGQLKDAEARLDSSCRSKEKIEKAICRQLHKTHDVLRKASSNLQEKSSAERLQQRHRERFHEEH